MTRTSRFLAPVRSAASLSGRRRLAVELALLLVVAVAAVLVLRGPSFRQGFTVDESRWIATSNYFWITFVERDLFGPYWQPNYLVYTHPPVARYIIGFGLWLQGWTPDQLNGRYDSLQSRAFNERAGNIPELDLLWAARRVTFVFAIASVLLVYGIARTLGGWLAGLAAAGLALVNPLLSTLWTRALAESIVATFTLLTLLLALRIMPRVGALGRWSWLPVTVGVALALAAATKLNGGIGALGMALYAGIQQAQALVLSHRTRGFRSWVDVALAAIIVFFAVNPLLYRNPYERALGLIEHRLDEMQFQQTVFSHQAVPDALDARVERVARRTFGDYATPPGPLPSSPDAPLMVLGIGVLAWRAAAELRRHLPGPALLFLCWLAASYGVITVNLGFDSSHYFAPLLSLNVVVLGVAAAALVNWGGGLVRRLASPPRAVPPVTRVGASGEADTAQNVQAPST